MSKLRPKVLGVPNEIVLPSQGDFTQADFIASAKVFTHKNPDYRLCHITQAPLPPAYKKLKVGSVLFNVVPDGRSTTLPAKLVFKSNVVLIETNEDGEEIVHIPADVYLNGSHRRSPYDFVYFHKDTITKHRQGFKLMHNKWSSALKYARYLQTTDFGAQSYDPEEMACECCSTDVLLEEPVPDFEAMDQQAAAQEHHGDCNHDH